MGFLALQILPDGTVNPNIASEDEEIVNQFLIDKQANFSEKEIEVHEDGLSFTILADGEQVRKYSVNIQ